MRLPPHFSESKVVEGDVGGSKVLGVGSEGPGSEEDLCCSLTLAPETRVSCGLDEQP